MSEDEAPDDGIGTRKLDTGWVWEWVTEEGIGVEVTHRLEWNTDKHEWLGSVSTDGGPFNQPAPINTDAIENPLKTSYKSLDKVARDYIARHRG